MEKIISQINLDANISKVLSSERIPHAMLITGKAGIGKLIQAIKIAQNLVCKNIQNFKACGTCPSCKKTMKFIHPDVHFTFPTFGKDGISDNFITEWRSLLESNPFYDLSTWLKHVGAEQKQGNIPKAECLNILKKINLQAFEGGNKVSIIWLPEFLGGEGNRLLKLIEEPPQNSYFILVSNNLENILGTIISRCQVINVKSPELPVVKNLLVNHYGAQENDVESMLAIAEGDINYAISLAQTKIDENFQHLQKMLRVSYKGDADELIQTGDFLSQFPKQQLKGYLEYVLHFIRQCMLLKHLPSDKIKLKKEELQFAQKFHLNLDATATSFLSKRLSEIIYYIERNANTKLLMTNLCIKLHAIMESNKMAVH